MLLDTTIPVAARDTDRWRDFPNWETVLPPNRPGWPLVSRIARLLRRRAEITTAAVLGATPEYVDLLHQVGVPEVVVLDRSPQFVEAMGEFRRFPRTEEVVIGDWCELLSGLTGRFDVVLSDFTLGNIQYDLQREFLRLVAGSLTARGCFVDRVLTYRRPCYEYDALARRFRDRPANLVTLNDFNARWLFCGARVARLGCVDTSATYDSAMREYSDPSIRWLAQNCERVSPRGMYWYYGRPWREVRRLYEGPLSLVSESPESRESPYFGWAYLRQSERRSVSMRPEASSMRGGSHRVA